MCNLRYQVRLDPLALKANMDMTQQVMKCHSNEKGRDIKRTGK